VSIPRDLAEKLGKLQMRAGTIGIVALVACVAGALASPQQFYRSYLIGYLLIIGIALGSLALLMIQHLITGGWGYVGRRVFEAATRTLPVLLVAFIPLVLGLTELYEWAVPEHVAGDELLEHKAAYLNVTFFLIRTALYFAIWIGLAFQLNRWSKAQDRGESVDLRRFQLVSGIGLLLFGLTVTFASVDWVMSLEPHWFSTIYGMQFIAGLVLAALAFTVPVLVPLSKYEPLSQHIERKHFHDFGNLMLAFVLLWAYLAFSQYLITWSGNLPEEIPWYLNRTQGGWQYIGLLLVVFHFAVPFFLLLSRATKRSARVLSRVAVAILVLRLVDLIWLVEPAFASSLSVHWMDFAAPMGIGGVWLAIFTRQLKALPLLPVNDPRFAENLEAEEALEHGAS
jgi:hypothetical protein